MTDQEQELWDSLHREIGDHFEDHKCVGRVCEIRDKILDECLDRIAELRKEQKE